MNLIWLGHSAFRIELGAAVILIDPFLTGNPKFTGDPERAAEGATHILLTHGHDDHVGDAVKIAKATGAQIAHGGARGQAFLQIRYRCPLPLRDLRSSRSERKPLRRGDARPSDKSCRAPRRRGFGVLTTAPCGRGHAQM
jgi:glyoxylase-like metal-dependent hydrolase (beta-lactamase superfamily II)